MLREFPEVFVHMLQPWGVFEFRLFLGDRFFLALEQFLGCVPPSTKVVFIEYD